MSRSPAPGWPRSAPGVTICGPACATASCRAGSRSQGSIREPSSPSAMPALPPGCRGACSPADPPYRMLITIKAWCRVDLAGGTLDIWPLGLFHLQARTINVAIDLAVTVGLRPLPEGYRVRQGGSVVEAGSAGELARHPEAALIGVAAEALDLPPFEALLASDSPRGGGLGASSAMTVAFLAAAEEAFDRPRSQPRELAAVA